MSTAHKPASKVATYRARMRAAGLRPVQFWVPDTRSQAFAARLRRQCKDLSNDSAEADVLRFTEAATTQIEGWE